MATDVVRPYFGWVPFENRSSEQIEIHDKIVAMMPKFQIFGATRSTEKIRCCLWDWVRPNNGGKDLETLLQETGSCVGNGAWNAVQYLMFLDAYRRGDAEKIVRIFLPYHYGRGRFRAGIRGTGDGSTGSGQADAVRLDGVLAQDADPSLPAPRIKSGGLTWGADVERKWSAGERIDDRLVQIGVKHPVKSTANVTSYTATRDAIANGYPVTVASMQGFQMAPRVDRGKSWGVPSGQWAHQMCFIGVDDDSARPGCYCQNSWGPDAHGKPADDAPAGGFWVDAEVVDRMTRQGDSFAYSQFEGFPEQLDFNVVR